MPEVTDRTIIVTTHDESCGAVSFLASKLFERGVIAGYRADYNDGWVEVTLKDAPSVSPEHRQLAEDLLVTALEGGSNYWYSLPDLSMVVRKHDEPTSIAVFRTAFEEANKAIPVKDVNDAVDLGVITKTGMMAAFDLMEKTYPRDYANLIGENWDAETADVWFQLAVMGKLVYG